VIKRKYHIKEFENVKGKGIMTLLEKYELKKVPKHEENLQ
jgi:hypothetical protein